MKNRLRVLLLKTERLAQTRQPAEPPDIDRPQFRDPVFITEVLTILNDIGALDGVMQDRPELFALLDEMGAFEDRPEEDAL